MPADSLRAMAHDEAELLLPWLVNGTLPAPEAASLRAHLAGCASCRAALAAERRIAEAIAARPLGEDALEAGWAKLKPTLPPRQGRPVGRAAAFGLGFALAASLALGAVLLREPAAPFTTLTTRATPAEAARLRASPAPGADPAALAALFASAGLSVVEGPGPAGVFTLAAADPPAAARAASALAASPLIALVVAGAP